MPVLALPVSRSVVLGQRASGPASFAYIAAGAINGVTASDTLTLAKPSGVTTNDLLIAGITHSNTYTMSTVPSGWALAHEKSHVGAWVHVYWKLCSGSEPANWSWIISGSASVNFTGAVIGLSGASTIAIDGTPTDAGTTGGTTVTLPSITTTAPNDLLVACVGQGGSRAYTPPGTMTERVDGVSGNGTIFIATEIVAAAGATGTRAVTGASLASPGVLIAFKG